jgi:hypothetical protein
MGWAVSPSRQWGRRPWITLLSVLAVAIQCFFVQTHVHGFGPSVPGSAAIVSLDVGHELLETHADHHSHKKGVPPHRHGGQQNCYLCQTALASAAILSSSPVLVVLERDFTALAPALHRVAETAPRSHNWQSRAPPLQL